MRCIGKQYGPRYIHLLISKGSKPMVPHNYMHFGGLDVNLVTIYWRVSDI